MCTNPPTPPFTPNTFEPRGADAFPARPESAEVAAVCRVPTPPQAPPPEQRARPSSRPGSGRELRRRPSSTPSTLRGQSFR
eukprot:gene40295-45427_t